MFFVFCCLSPGTESYESIIFSVESDGIVHQLSLWEDDGTYYLFLPSYAEMQSLKIISETEKDVSFNGAEVCTDSFSDIEFGKEYVLTIDGNDYPVIFLHSQNVATMYIDTISESRLDKVNSDKTHSEMIRLSVVEEDGTVSYLNQKYTDQIRGHGNSTWNYDKKSYNLTLNTPDDLINDSNNQNYVLIANAIDKTNLRNRIVYDMASETITSWNVSSKHMDLYVNGEYRGLYLLTDKIEVAENKLNLSQDCFLYNLEYNSRAKKDSVENIMPKISAELQNDKAHTDAEEEKAEETIIRIFGGITGCGIDDKGLEDCIDLESWASLYILQEFSSNYDSGTCSLYFYLKDGKLYAGPLWDYDNTLGQRKEFQADGFCARVTKTSPLWSSLTKYETFNNKVTELYKDVFAPEIEKLLHGRLAEMTAEIKTANELDYKRWHSFSISFFAEDYLTDLYGFINTKYQFLNSAWLSGEQYHDVFVGINSSTVYFSVKNNDTGESVNQILMKNFKDKNIIRFIDSETEDEIDFSEPINKDMNIIAICESGDTVPETENKPVTRTLISVIQDHKKFVFTGLFCLIFGVIGSALLVTDIRRNCSGGKKQ